jgi:hypothetical protein
VAISNHRLLSVSDSEVSFRWRDYAHRSRPRIMTLSPEEFLRRFLQHVLPRGFPRIRYFGWLANRTRGHLLPLSRFLLHQPQPPLRHRPRTSSPPGSALAAKARCTSSNDSPLPNSSSLSPSLQVHMTHPDPPRNPATLACLFPRVPDVCPGLGKKAVMPIPSPSPIHVVCLAPACFPLPDSAAIGSFSNHLDSTSH